MNTTVGFPTLGEMIKFAYESFGVLALKDDLSGEIDETEKKTIQTALRRLAKEEGNINENIGELIHSLYSLLKAKIKSQRIRDSVGSVLMDVLEVYQAVLKDNGTYLNKKDSMKWFLSDYAISRLAFSLRKHTLAFNVAGDNFTTPEGLWFLPTLTEEKIIYPLEKVMMWIYKECGQSKKSFHYPDESHSANHEQQERNLENVQNWMKGKSLPSLSALIWNFNYSIELINNAKNSDSRISISDHRQENFCAILFIARASTYICKAVFDNYGLPFAEEINAKFVRELQSVTDEFSRIKTFIENHLKKANYPPDTIDIIWYEGITDFCRHYANKSHQFSEFLKTKTPDEQAAIFQNPIEIENLIQHFGKFSVQSIAEKFNRTTTYDMHPDFPVYLHKGLVLKNNSHASKEEITIFETAIRASGTEPLLPWILPWIKGAYHYRREEYDLAYPFFQEAFNSAKYCAGLNQYKLINQFVEVAAKNNKFLEFKKGVRWAQYLGIEIRWLRKDEPTDEKLDYVFEMMKVAVYPSL